MDLTAGSLGAVETVLAEGGEDTLGVGGLFVLVGGGGLERDDFACLLDESVGGVLETGEDVLLGLFKSGGGIFFSNLGVEGAKAGNELDPGARRESFEGGSHEAVTVLLEVLLVVVSKDDSGEISLISSQRLWALDC